jgi:hypothetical protein
LKVFRREIVLSGDGFELGKNLVGLNSRRAAKGFASGIDPHRLITASKRLENALNRRGIDSRRSGGRRETGGVRATSSVFELVLLGNNTLSRRRVRGRRPEDFSEIRQDLSFLRDQSVEVLRGGLFVGDRPLQVLKAINRRDGASVLFDICWSSSGKCRRRHIETSKGRNKSKGEVVFGRKLSEKIDVFDLSELCFHECGLLLHLSLHRHRRRSGFRRSGYGFRDALNTSDVGLSLLLSKGIDPSAVRCFRRLFGFRDREVLLLPDASQRRLLRLFAKEDVPAGRRSSRSGGGGLECHRFQLARRGSGSDTLRTFEPRALLLR